MIDKEMKIEDVLRRFPQTIPVFRRFGIDCVNCQLSEYEDLERGARVHGIDLGSLLAELNAAIGEKG